MKRYVTLLVLILATLLGQSQTIDPALLKEMGQRRDNEKIRVFVIMRQQYDKTLLNSRAEHFATRAERRDFVVKELKQFADATQSDLRHALFEMKRNAMVSEPKELWIANALYFEASKQAIYDLASRTDIEVIGYDQEVDLPPVKESSLPPDKASRDITPNVTQVGADQVWGLGYTGQGVVVAVVDSGVNYDHLDLANHLWDGGPQFPHHGYNLGDNNDDPMDHYGHGTHCAGTVCGDGGAGKITGMAPDVTLMCVKISVGESGSSSVALMCDGMQWATEHGCDIFSFSYGRHTDAADKTLYRNTCVNVLSAGVIGSIAAGNEGGNLADYPIPSNVRFPGGCPPPYMDPVQQGNPGGLSCSVCIGAVDYNDVAADFTSIGPVTWTNTSYADYPYVAGSSTQFGLIRPDVCAPGVDIISADYANNMGHCVMSGTSMATPCAAGCMALMLSKNPNLTPADICRILEETAVPLAEGKSNIYGYGRVDALAAVNAVPANVLSLSSYYIHDEQGNNNHQLNAGEAVTMDLDLVCGDTVLNNATLNITTTSDLVTITNGTLSLPNFAPGQSQTVSGFAFTVSNDAPVRRKMTFYADVSVDGILKGQFAFTLAVIGRNLVYEGATISGDDNGNGLLEAGETASLHIVIDNIGNETAPYVIGTLSSSSQYLTINNNTASLGDMAIFEPINADFSITLSANASNAFPIPFTFHLVDAGGQTKDLEFSMYNITTTPSPQGAGVLTGTGTYGVGASVRITAVADDSHTLISWKTDNTVVSYTDFDIVVSDNVDYVAYFNSISKVVPIGQAVASNGILPTHSYYNYCLTEQIYTVEELGEAHDISSVAFFNAGTAKTRNCRIFLQSTDKSVFQNSSDWVAATPDDLLFEGDITFTKGEWTTIYFNRAFAYDGIHNVVLIIDDNTGSYSSGMACRVFKDTPYMALYNLNDNTNFDPYNPFDNNGNYLGTYRSQVLFGIASYDYNVTVNADPMDDGTVSVDEGPFFQGQPCTVTAMPSGNNVFYYWSENGERVSDDATYHFRVMDNRQLVAHFGPPVTVTVVADPEEGGAVSGGGSYGIGQPITLSATTNPGYVFSHWSKNGEAVSYLSTWELLVPGEAEYVAHYNPLPQGAVVVGEAASTNAILPCYSYYKYTLSQQIYTAAEIGEAGLIGSVAFFNTGYQRKRNLTIYMVNTTKSAFGSDTDWIVPTEEQQVFSGEVVMAKGHWTTVVLDKAFEYNGASNLAIIVDDNSGYWTSERVSCRVFETGARQAIRVYSDGTNYDPLSPSGYSGTRMTVKNQILVTKVTPTAVPLSVSASAAPAGGGTIIGGGVYGFGETCVVSAIPNEGYAFAGWFENGTVVSTDMSYGFGVFGERDLVAHFSRCVQIGDGGTGKEVYLPSYNYYKYSLTEQIYTAEEIGRAGAITSIAFYNGGAEKTRTYDAYLAATSKAAFTGNQDWVAVTGADKVFSGVVTMPSGGWTTIIFDVPFEYDGTSNLVLAVDDNTGSWTGSPHMSCRVFDAPGQAIYVYSDNTNYNPGSPSGYSGTLAAVKNQIILGGFFFHFTTAGNWSSTFNWQYQLLPTPEDEVFIDAPCHLDQNVEVAALTISEGQTLTLQSGNSLTVTGDLINTLPEGLVIEDGAQLVNSSENVAATVKKNVTAYGSDNPNAWYTIASPMNLMPIEGCGFVTPEYDLYRFNETNLTGEEWENHKANFADFTTFEKGRGYLYANGNTLLPAFTGTLNASAVTIPLTCTERPDDPLSGFNLIGNPFPHNIYKGAGGAIDDVNLAAGYYTLTNEGTWQVHTFEDAILPGQGILVKATAPIELTIAKSNEEAFAESGEAKKGVGHLSISVSGDGGHDRAYVYFGHGVDLAKVEDYGQSATNLAIRTEKGDYAIAHFDRKSDAVELVFTTTKDGSFTLTVDVPVSDFEYLHLIDQSTGDDIDLKAALRLHSTGSGTEAQGPQEPTSYTFTISEQAGERCFKLVYKQLEK